MKGKPAVKKPAAMPEWVKVLLDLVPPGVAVVLPRQLRRRLHDPIPEPTPDFTSPKYLEQVSLGRWIDESPGKKADELRDAFHTLADFIARRAENYVFPDGATDEQRERLVGVLEGSYRRGFYLALLRYADDLKAVPEAASMLKALGAGRKKGGKATQKKAAPKRMAVRRRYRELRKQGFKPKQARLVIHEDTGFSIRQIERDTKGLS
jgi:hypothetical protein